MLVKELLSHSTCKVRNGNFLKMRVSEICVKRIRVNQGVGANGKLVTGNGSLIPIKSLLNRSLLPSLTVYGYSNKTK